MAGKITKEDILPNQNEIKKACEDVASAIQVLIDELDKIKPIKK